MSEAARIWRRWGTIQAKAQGTKRRLLGCDIVASRPEQPAAAGIDDARPFRLRGEGWQQHVEQATIDCAHVAAEIAGGMDNGIHKWKPPGPSLGRCDVAGDRRRATFDKLRRSGVGSRQTADVMSAPDELSHHRCADRTRPTQNQNAHDPAP
jgi:hypothetical protein